MGCVWAGAPAAPSLVPDLEASQSSDGRAERRW